MDTVTHALVGAAISDCWFRRRLGRIATPFALAMGALPDIDSFTYLASAESAWRHHRGYTHSFFPILVAAPLLGYLGYRLAKREGGWGQWAFLAVLCLCAHTLLDLVTSWGTMPFLPFSNARISWDVAPVLDAFVFSITGASFVANRLLRRERVDHFMNPLAYPVVHRHPHRRRAADWVGKAAVCLTVLYLLLGWNQNRQTVRLAREELAKTGIDAVEVRALPIMFTYIAWDVAARDADGNIYNAVHSSYAPKPLRFTKYETLPKSDVERITATPEGGMFAWYSQGMFVGRRLGDAVSLYDRRFFTLSDPSRPAFSMDFIEGADGSLRWMGSKQRDFSGFDVRSEFERLWRLTWHGEGDGETTERAQKREETVSAPIANAS